MTLPDFTIPLKNRDGDWIGYAVVSGEDYAELGEFNWSLNNSGYAIRTARAREGLGVKKGILMHRQIMGLHLEQWDAVAFRNRREVDHINGNRLDNRRTNLRIVTRAQNLQNQRREGSSSRYRGVWHLPSRNRWVAEVRVGGERRIKYCVTEDEAGAVARVWRRELLPLAPD